MLRLATQRQPTVHTYRCQLRPNRLEAAKRHVTGSPLLQTILKSMKTEFGPESKNRSPENTTYCGLWINENGMMYIAVKDGSINQAAMMVRVKGTPQLLLR